MEVRGLSRLGEARLCVRETPVYWILVDSFRTLTINEAALRRFEHRNSADRVGIFRTAPFRRRSNGGSAGHLGGSTVLLTASFFKEGT
jgi:hypothetical protein